MARKMIVQRDDGSSPVLTETSAQDEFQLQELMKNNPDLLPIDEFEMSGPLLVIGRETPLPSGAVDLVTLARGGEMLLIEFKTGPQNADFRAALAQLLDYGSDLWRMSYNDFEATVATRYFRSGYCKDQRFRGKSSLVEAAREEWTNLSEEEMALFKDRISSQLSAGAFHYMVVAQRFTPTIVRTIEYLNSSMQGSRFYAVELVRFAAAGLSAFESRVVLKPAKAVSGTRGERVSEESFLEAIQDEGYKTAMKELFEFFHGLDLRLAWGSAGASIRLRTSERGALVSIGWLFPPDKSGWMGLRDLTLGFDTASAARFPNTGPALEAYVEGLKDLPGASPLAPSTGLRGCYLRPEVVVRARDRIGDLLTALVQKANS